MSTWDFNRDERDDNGFRWDGEEDDDWNFDPLDGFDWGEENTHSQNQNNATAQPQRLTSFTADDFDASPPRRQTSRAGGNGNGASSFLDNLLNPATSSDPPRRSILDQLPSRAHRNQSPPARSRAVRPAGATNGQNHFGYLPNNLFDTISGDEATPQSTRRSSLSGITSAEEFVTLEDDSDQEYTMPAATRRTNPSNRRSSVVDLTATAPSAGSSRPAPRRRKRSADLSDPSEGRAPKRGRTAVEDIEKVDLSKEPLSAEEELLQKQQQEAIKLQQDDEENQGSLRIGKRTCIICMENFTNCTIASCGHFYCHECLYQALLAGEKNSDRGTGTCPQCRKPLSRKKKHDVIPLSFMKKSTFEKNQKKRAQMA